MLAGAGESVSHDGILSLSLLLFLLSVVVVVGGGSSGGHGVHSC